MPDYPPNDALAGNQPELAAIDAVRMTPDDKESIPGLKNLVDALDQRPIRRHLKGDYLPGARREKKEGDFGDEHKIPFLVVRK